MKKILTFISSKKYLIMGVLGAVLLALTLKTQVIIIKYGNNYSMRMEYSVFGYCLRASAALKATEPAVQGAIYVGGSIDSTVQQAVKQMSLIDNTKQTVGIMSSGYPKNNDELEQHLKKILENNGETVEILDVSLSDALSVKK